MNQGHLPDFTASDYRNVVSCNIMLVC